MEEESSYKFFLTEWKPTEYTFKKVVGMKIEPKVCQIEDRFDKLRNIWLFRLTCDKAASDHDKLVELQELHRYFVLAIQHLKNELQGTKTHWVEDNLKDAIKDQESEKRLVDREIGEIMRRLHLI